MIRSTLTVLALVLGCALSPPGAMAGIRTTRDTPGGITIGSATRDRPSNTSRPGPRYLSSVGRPVVRSLPIVTPAVAYGGYGYGGYGYGIPTATPVFRLIPASATPASGVRVATFPQIAGPRSNAEIVSRRLNVPTTVRRGVIQAPENPMLQRARDQSAQQRLLLTPR